MPDQNERNSAEAGTPERCLQKSGIVLPDAPKPLGAYEPWVITGSLLMTSGQFPYVNGELAYTGRIGSDLTPEQAYDACRLSAINVVAQLKQAVSSLDRIRRILRVEGTMQVEPGFQEHPVALNGASDLFNELFSQHGGHSRMIYTNPEMPLNAPVLIVVVAELMP